MRIVSGQGCHLISDTGERYLDAGVSNALLGHADPDVARAIAGQSGVLTSGLYASTQIAEQLGKVLLRHCPPSFTECLLVQSLSEATELALRIARSHARGKDVIVQDNADYGITTTLRNMSPARGHTKYWVHVASRTDAGKVADLARKIHASGRGLCAFFSDGIAPNEYLPAAFDAVRAAGGVAIQMEAGVGLGRVGLEFWGFQLAGAEPDLIVIGEELANGMPIGAVILADRIAQGLNETNSSPAPNPVSCAAALATLEKLSKCRPPVDLKAFLPDSLRGAGASFEMDVVNAEDAIEVLRFGKILIRRRGNTLLIRPPLTISAAELDRLRQALASIQEAG